MAVVWLLDNHAHQFIDLQFSFRRFLDRGNRQNQFETWKPSHLGTYDPFSGNLEYMREKHWLHKTKTTNSSYMYYVSRFLDFRLSGNLETGENQRKLGIYIFWHFADAVLKSAILESNLNIWIDSTEAHHRSSRNSRPGGGTVVGDYLTVIITRSIVDDRWSMTRSYATVHE